MRVKSLFRAVSLGIMLLLSLAVAQSGPNKQNRVDRWNDLWINFQNNGCIGNDGSQYSFAQQDPCPPHDWAPQCEMPGGSGQQYLCQGGLWIGAMIDSGGILTKRVSIGTDGWVPVRELWPSDSAHAESFFSERSRRDTFNCWGANIYSPTAAADHELSCTFSDTLTDERYTARDPVDGAHRPLGVKITQTTYAMMNPACNHIYWIHYAIENIGPNLLRDVYLGEFVDGDVIVNGQANEYVDDLTGFEPSQQMAYICDNDGRPAGVGEGSDFTVPHVSGMMFLGPFQGVERISYNWWMPDTDESLDFGPAWSAYADRDSLGMGWASRLGTPMGDEHRYQLLSNGEHDYDQLHVADTTWIRNHPQNSHAWTTSGLSPRAFDMANGYDTRYLLSIGPLGTPSGNHTELRPGEHIDVWAAYIGGMNLHQTARPQPTDTIIDPLLFDFSDLITKAQAARAGICFDWSALSANSPRVLPSDFMLDGIYPNPFNGTASIRFRLERETRVDISIFDLLGRSVERLAATKYSAGEQVVQWNGSRFASGLYLVRVSTATQQSAVGKMMLLR